MRFCKPWKTVQKGKVCHETTGSDGLLNPRRIIREMCWRHCHWVVWLRHLDRWQPRMASGRQGWNLKPTRVTRDLFFKKGKMRPSKAPYCTLDWLNFNMFLKCSSTSTYRPESPLRLKTEDLIEQPPKPRKCVIPSMIITNHYIPYSFAPSPIINDHDTQKIH